MYTQCDPKASVMLGPFIGKQWNNRITSDAILASLWVTWPLQCFGRVAQYKKEVLGRSRVVDIWPIYSKLSCRERSLNSSNRLLNQVQTFQSGLYLQASTTENRHYSLLNPLAVEINTIVPFNKNRHVLYVCVWGSYWFQCNDALQTNAIRSNHLQIIVSTTPAVCLVFELI